MLYETGFELVLSMPFENAREVLINTLKEEGFGVLTEIDVKATMKEKLDKEFRPYRILGVCNPPLAYKALSTDPRIGLLLPCNVTIEENENGTLVRIINPDMMLTSFKTTENETFEEIASDASKRLQKVIGALQKQE